MSSRSRREEEMANGNKKDEPRISPYFIALAAGILIILLAVLLVMSGVLDRAFSNDSHEETPSVETTVSEVPSETPESTAPSPTPTEMPTYQVYVTAGYGGDAYATTNTVKDGETDHITVIPDVGYSVGSININGTPSGYYGSFDLTEIHMDTVIHIEFVPMQTEEEAASDNEE